jgi:hypothetical protein
LRNWKSANAALAQTQRLKVISALATFKISGPRAASPAAGPPTRPPLRRKKSRLEALQARQQALGATDLHPRPRGMEFPYSRPRAKGLCILIASPSVFEAQIWTPRQMQLANAFRRYLEL